MASRNNTALLGLGLVATGGLVYFGTRGGWLPLPESLERRVPEFLRSRSKRPVIEYTKVETTLLDTKTKKPKIDKKGRPVTIIRSAETADQLAAKTSAKLGMRVPTTTFLLGSMIASEAGSMHGLVRTAVAQAAINYSAKRNRSIVKMLAPNGKVGSQIGRYASTRYMPTPEDIQLAELVLSRRVADPTYGAIQFDSPKVQEQGYAEGWAGYGPVDEVTRNRLAAGLEEVLLPGIPRSEIRFWRPKGAAPSLRPAV